MKIRYLLSYVLIICIFIYTCAAPKFNLQPAGDIAVLKMKNNSVYKGEFLFIKDGDIYLLVDKPQIDNPYAPKSGSVSTVQIKQIESIEIEGYSNRSWGASILAFQVVPAFILAGVGASVDGENFLPVLGISSIPILITWLLFEGSTPTAPTFDHLLKEEKLEELNKYSRFPMGLTDNQLKDFLEIYKQKEIKQF